ncbi:MAG: DUF2097 family protein [Methanobrevibacter sp.]|nr:DUF2097 family protein [Methanobrevibacter sp.]
MKKLELKNEEAVNFLEENLNVHDTLAIGYNRVFAKGEVTNIEEPEYRIFMNLINEDDSPSVEINISKIKNQLIEYTIYPQDGDDVCVVVI